MYKLLIYIFLIFLAGLHTACKSKLKNDEGKLVEMITDFHIAKAAMERYPPHDRDSIYQVFSDQIFKIHKVSKTSFEYDIIQLEKDPQKYQLILDQVTSRLTGNEEKSSCRCSPMMG